LKGWKPLEFVIIDENLSYTYLGCKTVSTPEHVINISSHIRENSGDS
jgi:hypothetical protein